MRKYKIAVVVGIRPDFIRTSEVLRLLDERKDVDLSIIHTGQHYDKNLNDVFFDELDIPKITYQLDTRGKNHNEQHSKLIIQLSDTLEAIKPDVCVFLGDANAVIGSIAPLKLGIPIAHIEAGMRSYDWIMPEERNRVIVDRISDVLYVYQDDYRVQLVQEGVDPSRIVVTGNIIVDVLNRHKYEYEWPWGVRTPGLTFDTRREDKEINGYTIRYKSFALMTLHRNEHMIQGVAQGIIDAVGRATKARNLPTVLIEMPRLKALDIQYPSNFIPVDPMGFFEFVELEKGAAIEYTDSGTNQEVASILGTPCVVTRSCTERPECADSNTTVLSNPARIEDATKYVLSKDYNRDFSLGDGKSSRRIVDDLLDRLSNNWYKTKPYYDRFKGRHFDGF